MNLEHTFTTYFSPAPLHRHPPASPVICAEGKVANKTSNSRERTKKSHISSRNVLITHLKWLWKRSESLNYLIDDMFRAVCERMRLQHEHEHEHSPLSTTLGRPRQRFQLNTSEFLQFLACDKYDSNLLVPRSLMNVCWRTDNAER